MRILLCDTLGATGPLNADILEKLEISFAALGHETEKVVVPYNDDTRHSAKQLIAMRMMQLSGRSDAAICLSPPALLIPHVLKLIWLCREPASLAIEATAPQWLKSALTAGYNESIAAFVSTDPQRESLARRKIASKLMEIPTYDLPQNTRQWQKITNAILKQFREKRAK